jgi:aminoglycoside phosphotransferase (APT) family kinase protein
MVPCGKAVARRKLPQIPEWVRLAAMDVARLAAVMAQTLGKDVVVTGAFPLRGGAVRRHWRIDAAVDGEGRRFALRTEGLTPLGMGLDLGAEFALLRRLKGAGIAVPEPVLFSDDPGVTGAPFHLGEFLPGSADGGALAASGPHEALAERLGRELASVQVVPGEGGMAPSSVAAARLAHYRSRLDAMGEARPAAEWAMRWMAEHVPRPLPPVLCHGDFRTGNYLVEDGRFVALVDWEFAEWGDPDEDLGWFCSRCWRFGAFSRDAGGIAPRAVLYRGYEAGSGRRVDPGRLQYWEAMAALKWLVIALLQRNRCLVAGERSLDLALTGRRAAECEWELMRLTGTAGGDA